MSRDKININARLRRHSNIDFKNGFYSKNKAAYTKATLRFLFKVFVLSISFVIINFISYEFVSAYPEDINEIDNIVDLEISASQVFVLGDNGFVLKPSTQTEKGDRSTANKIIEYTVESGDTIYGIAAKFSLRSQTIIDNNSEISEWSILKVGKVLKILPVDGLLYTLQAKDTLESISKKFDIKKEDILRQNQIKEKDFIQGKDLIIPGAKRIYVKEIIPIKKSNKYNKFTYNDVLYNGVISGSFIWPANGKITQYYNRWHYAIDIANRNQGPILASANGTVMQASYGWNGGYGNVVIIDHGNGFKTLYAHNSKLYVNVGDNVKQGQTISWMGNTGRVRGKTGIHLHYEVIQNGYKKNPLAYLGMR